MCDVSQLRMFIYCFGWADKNSILSYSDNLPSLTPPPLPLPPPTTSPGDHSYVMYGVSIRLYTNGRKTLNFLDANISLLFLWLYGYCDQEAGYTRLSSYVHACMYVCCYMIIRLIYKTI